MIDALASASHYADHIRPVWEALPPQLRGVFHTRPRPLAPGPPTIVASYVDLRNARGRTAIFMEHGAGQTYRKGHQSYAGGRGREHVGLFLSPNERVDALNRAAYPNAEHAVIGCPLLDPWVGHKPHNSEPVISFAWHWDASAVAPEARSALAHYQRAIPHLPYRLLGHGHPRFIGRWRSYYQRHGIEWTPDFTEVLERADVLLFDNTSAGFMFAATGRPVVVLDAPWYQKTWGGRFWEWADVGVRIQQPGQLKGAIEEALADAPERAQRRADIVSGIYEHLDGTAAQRAATAVEQWAEQRLEAAA